jgi:putative transposase
MDGSIRLSPADRKAVSDVVQRGGGSHRAVRRAHVLLLLADGHSGRWVMAVLYCSSDLVTAVRDAFRAGGVAAVLSDRPAARPIPRWWASVLAWVLGRTPGEFGFRRSRWSCGALATAVRERLGVRVGRETIRKVLHDLGLAWRRPRPVVGPADPDHDRKMRAIRRWMAALPPDQVAVFQDEVQLDLNPKIGSAWMLRGFQAEVVTPGDNDRRHLAASVVAGSGMLVVSRPTRRRNAEQFLAHLADLCGRLRRWRVIHVICDNAAFHKSRAVQRWVADRGGRVSLHYLPTRAPEENPVEQVFWRLHEAVTRNHRCRTIDELVRRAVDWLAREGRATRPTAYGLAA